MIRARLTAQLFSGPPARDCLWVAALELDQHGRAQVGVIVAVIAVLEEQLELVESELRLRGRRLHDLRVCRPDVAATTLEAPACWFRDSP
jgi:hypothetical protein